MPKWTPVPEWRGQDAIIIGGGSSLDRFDFSKLKGRNTIGCNDAFRLGPEIVRICFFGDSSWFHKNKWDLEKWSFGRIATCSTSLGQIKLDWLLQLERSLNGLHEGGVVGWNYSTGAAAINLAISLGAAKVFLLGFDLNRRKDGQSHWHNYNTKPIMDTAFARFIRGFEAIKKDLHRFPEVSVFNVTDGSSGLHAFARITFEEFDRVLALDPRFAPPPMEVTSA
jgi:hypothetical protein